jgi:hypothetical protein
MLAVFLNNKLITCDTITPLALTLHELGIERSITFLTTDKKTYRAIRENVVLSEAINRIGRLRLMRRRPFSLLMLAWYLIMGLIGKAYFLHFKALNFWPFKLFALLCPSRTILCEGTAIGVSALEQKVAETMIKRRISPVTPQGNTLVGFGPEWPILSDPRVAGRRSFILPAPFRFRSWQRFVGEVSVRYLDGDPDIGSARQEGRPIVVFILSSLDHTPLLANPLGLPQLFEETMDALAEELPEAMVVIKPHPATTFAMRQRVEGIVKRYPNARLSNLHPSILSKCAAFVIGNNYSTTFSIFRSAGVPTIEYTDYRPDILSVTCGGSARPEFVTRFIARDSDILRGALREFGQANRLRSTDDLSVPDPVEELTTIFNQKGI